MTLNTQYAYEAYSINGELKKIALPYDFFLSKEEEYKYMSLQFSVEFKHDGQKYRYSTYVVDEALAHKTEQEIAYMLYDAFLTAFASKLVGMHPVAEKAFKKRLAKCIGFEFDFDAVEKKPQKQMDWTKGPISFIGGYNDKHFFSQYKKKIEELEINNKYVYFDSNPAASISYFNEPLKKIEPHKVKGASAGTASKALPGIDVEVKYPCGKGCVPNGIGDKMWSVVQHLNDFHKDWTRERIAEWLDDLHDKGLIDIEFPVMTEEPVEVDKTGPRKNPVKSGYINNYSFTDEFSGWKELGFVDETKEKK